MLEETIPESNAEEQEMGSLNHSYIQANLAWLLKNLKIYSVFTELSLNINNLDLTEYDSSLKNEVKPDVCVYPKMSIDCSRDIIKMSEMPLLAIEILSPNQPVQTLLQKIDCYFKLGIKSCWLIYPSAATVVVYADLHHFKAFSSGELIDETLDIRFNTADIFN
jgi:Uma2 family endonuclease